MIKEASTFREPRWPVWKKDQLLHKGTSSHAMLQTVETEII